MSGHKGRRGGHEEEHENHERWLISYADMITLLMVLFVVMFAISNVDQKKFAELSSGLAAGFGAPRFVALDGAQSPLSGAGPLIDPIQVVITPVGPPGGDAVDPSLEEEKDPQEVADDRAAAEAELARLDAVQAEAEAALAAQGLQDRAGFRITTDGLVVVLFADDVFFANGSAVIEPTGERVVDTLAPVLARAGGPVSAEGHANHIPVSAGSIYPSNWELSAARAATVARRMVEVDGFAAERVSATGYGDTRPLVPVADPASVTTNRRVDLLLRSTAPAEVRELLPTLAATRS